METLKDLKLTNLERTVIFHLAYCDEYNEMACANLIELTNETKIDSKILRGVLASLSKKEIIEISEYPNREVAYLLYNEYNHTLI